LKYDLKNNFTYHPPKPEQVDKYNKLRLNALVLAEMLDNYCPESREKSLAMTKLEEAVMWANASIARNT
jgi:hypothetical protein